EIVFPKILSIDSIFGKTISFYLEILAKKIGMSNIVKDKNKEFDDHCIQELCHLAEQSARQGFDPFAALLSYDNQVKASTMDQSIKYSDPTAHAELILISEYCRTHTLIHLEGYTLYTFVEPCLMCFGAIHWARISRMVYCLGQAELQAVSNGRPKPSVPDLLRIWPSQIEVKGPHLLELGIEIMHKYPFQSKKERHQKHWSLNPGQKKSEL
ncbi:MAG: nucleoside deaminase, partial [Bacteroidota bacterium]